MFRFFLLSAIFCVLFAATAADEKKQETSIKSGTVVAAAISASKPEIQEPYGNQKKSSPYWLEITVKPDDGRSASIHDYVILSDGSEISCIAVAQGQEPYSGTKWKTDKLNSSATFRMLFPVPSKDGAYKIKFNLLPTAFPSVKLDVTDAK